jgi:hypothetical protein
MDKLDQYRVFIRVAEAGSFIKAAMPWHRRAHRFRQPFSSSSQRWERASWSFDH